MLIDGKLVDSETGRQFDNVNPATEEVIGSTADGTRADMERAVAAARNAFDSTDWSRNGEVRAAGLRQLQAALEAEREDIRSELVAEVGCPVLSTYGPQLDVPLKEALAWPADMISEFAWKRSLPDKDAFGMGTPAAREVWKEPVGVVGVVTPWNFPFEIILNKIGPILAMGNTMVLKPAPDTPWNATRIGRLIAEQTDIPPGVINIVTSSDHLVGEVLSTSPSVDMVAFTGSTATGRRIMKAAAETLKPTFLELGGKSVYLVLEDDGDISATVGGSAFIMMHAGQGCAMPTRLLVPNSRYEEAVEIVKAAMEKNKYGDPTDPSVLGQDQRDNYATHGSIRFSRDATPLKVNAHLVCFKVAAKRSRDFFAHHLAGGCCAALVPPKWPSPGAPRCQSCLHGSTRHRVTLPNLLTRQEPAIGRHS